MTEHKYIMSVLSSEVVTNDISYIVDRITKYEDMGHNIRVDVCCHEYANHYIGGADRLNVYPIVSNRYHTQYGDRVSISTRYLDSPYGHQRIISHSCNLIKQGRLCYQVDFNQEITSIYEDVAKQFTKLEILGECYNFNRVCGIILKARL